MKKQLVKVIHNGIYKVIYNDTVKYNPYKVYYTAAGKQQKINEFADFASCMYYLSDRIFNGKEFVEW